MTLLPGTWQLLGQLSSLVPFCLLLVSASLPRLELWFHWGNSAAPVVLAGARQHWASLLLLLLLLLLQQLCCDLALACAGRDERKDGSG
jgi:TRAP-type mannitol/chloroaromatic compound transport system permease small subunit